MVSRNPDGEAVFPAVKDVEITSRVGSGPTGEVYKARWGKRTVALKVYRDSSESGDAEVERLAKFVRGRDGAPRHPNLLSLHEVGRTEDGSIYCSMPLLEGDPLSDLLGDIESGRTARPSLGSLAVGPDGSLHPLQPRHAARVFAEVADGLSVLHRAGVAHGHLHPRNLVFAPSGRLVVTGLGETIAAKHTNGSGAPSTNAKTGKGKKTREQNGTSAPLATDADRRYLAPEVQAGNEATPTSDVYSLGAMLAAVTGCGPSADESAVGQAAQGFRNAGLAAVIRRAVAEDPGQRYADASELAAELHLFLSDRPTRAERELERRTDSTSSNGKKESTQKSNAREGTKKAEIASLRVRLDDELTRRDKLEADLERALARADEADRALERESRGRAHLEREIEASRREGAETVTYRLRQEEETRREIERDLESERRRRAQVEKQLVRAEKRIAVEVERFNRHLAVTGLPANPEDAAPEQLAAHGQKPRTVSNDGWTSEARRSGPGVLSIVATLAVFAALLSWALLERNSRQGIEEHVGAVSSLLQAGSVDAAMDESRSRPQSEVVASNLTRLVSAFADHEASRKAMAHEREALVSAVRETTSHDLTAAAERLELASSEFSGATGQDSTELRALAHSLEREARRDLVVEQLTSVDGAERSGALFLLDVELSAGKRPLRDALSALKILERSDDGLLARALTIAARAGDSEALLNRLGVGPNGEQVTLSTASFVALYDALESIDDELARSLLCSWSLADHRALDGLMAERGVGELLHVALNPNIVVEVPADGAERKFTRRWLARASRHDAERVVAHAFTLGKDVELSGSLVRALTAAGKSGPRRHSGEVLAALAVGSPYVHGNMALAALRELGDADQLIDIARDAVHTGAVPVALRAGALEELRGGLFELCLGELRTVALTSPHPQLRTLAFASLSQSDAPIAVTAIPEAVNDEILKDDALAWLKRLPPADCTREALELLHHDKGAVRRVAVDVLQRVDRPQLLLPLVPRLADPDPGVRAAAITVLKSKSRMLDRSGNPEQLAAAVNDMLRSVGYPFRADREIFDRSFRAIEGGYRLVARGEWLRHAASRLIASASHALSSLRLER